MCTVCVVDLPSSVSGEDLLGVRSEGSTVAFSLPFWSDGRVFNSSEEAEGIMVLDFLPIGAVPINKSHVIWNITSTVTTNRDRAMPIKVVSIKIEATYPGENRNLYRENRNSFGPR